jgi:hypothetical protein
MIKKEGLMIIIFKDGKQMPNFVSHWKFLRTHVLSDLRELPNYYI